LPELAGLQVVVDFLKRSLERRTVDVVLDVAHVTKLALAALALLGDGVCTDFLPGAPLQLLLLAWFIFSWVDLGAIFLL
jgi:hypothetical protein